jgi:hypothetical protein
MTAEEDATMNWDGEWKPTLPMTRDELARMRMVGITSLEIGEVEIACRIAVDPWRRMTFAQAINSERWYQLVPPRA